MKRKIIKLGQATFVISLPSKWVRELELKAGDYLDVDPKGIQLTVRSEKKADKKDIALDIKGFDTKLARAYMENAYVLSYDPIEMSHDETLDKYFSLSKEEDTKRDTAQFIQDEVNEVFIGSEIIEQSKKRTVIKDMYSGLDENTVENVFRRLLFLSNSIAKDAVQSLRKKDEKMCGQVRLRIRSANKLALYYVRVVNRSDIDSDQIKIMNTIASHLRFIIWTYDAILRAALDKNNFFASKSLDVLEELGAHFIDLNTLLLGFDKKKMREFIKTRETLYKKVYSFKAEADDFLLYFNFGRLIGSIWFAAKLEIARHMLDQKK
jgi:phosphate uptake regulator